MFRETYSISQLQAMFEVFLEKEAFIRFPEVLRESAKHIMLMKGKRIRPTMLLTACHAYGGDLKNALGPAGAVEIFHNFSLVHDDIIDNADIRRGQASVHKKYGLNKAILTGDAMLLHSFMLLKNGPKDKLATMMKTFGKATSEVIEGEQIDVDFEKVDEVSVEEYINMIKLKTSVLLAASVQLGAIIGNAPPSDQEKIYDFGLNLGLSFQIKDDYLDAYGDFESFGKRIGGDIVQNKKTYLQIMALNSANKEQKERIFQLFHEENEELKIKKMLLIFNELDVKKNAKKKMEELYKQAISSLSALSLSTSERKPLTELAEMVYHRKH